MTSLISYGTGSEPDDSEESEPIANNDFWPDIEPADFVVVERIDSSATPARIKTALQIAITDVNRQLADWQATQIGKGHESHASVEPPVWAIADHFKTLYLRAVYATAKATLLERYRDQSATPGGDNSGQAKDEAADDYRRDARWAVCDIEGKPHSTVELI
ncbi:MAG: head completion/stabilization protein [Pseudohongiella sp.]|nr:head completion/stabilization protein [Pseudohongiella sp.]